MGLINNNKDFSYCEEMTEKTKWVACWGNATSITNRREAIYAKNITLRYPIRMCFNKRKVMPSAML